MGQNGVWSNNLIGVVVRNVVKAPENRITQGTVFYGARSPYGDQACYGVGITARCDTAREFKAATFTFLPIVSVKDWLLHEALPKVAADLLSSVKGALKAKLMEKDGTDVVLTAFGVEAAFEKLGVSEKAIKSARQTYDDAMAAMALKSDDLTDLPKSVKKALHADFVKLTKGTLQDFFFLDQIEAFPLEGQTLGYVVLLRDVRSIDRKLALTMLGGMDRSKLLACVGQDDSSGHLFVGDDDLALPVSEIVSPYVEKLLQNFSMLFGRIGTKDVPESCSQAVFDFLEV